MLVDKIVQKGFIYETGVHAIIAENCSRRGYKGSGLRLVG